MAIYMKHYEFRADCLLSIYSAPIEWGLNLSSIKTLGRVLSDKRREWQSDLEKTSCITQWNYQPFEQIPTVRFWCISFSITSYSQTGLVTMKPGSTMSFKMWKRLFAKFRYWLLTNQTVIFFRFTAIHLIKSVDFNYWKAIIVIPGCFWSRARVREVRGREIPSSWSDWKGLNILHKVWSQSSTVTIGLW